MIKDIKEVVAAAKNAGATVVNDLRVVGVSLYPAKEESNVDYYATLSLNKPVKGMYIAGNNGDGTPKWAQGLTTTITVPFGSLKAVLFDALLDVDDNTVVKVGKEEKTVTDAALDCVTYKALLCDDAIKEALAGDDSKYVSYFSKLINLTKVNVICRPVKKGEKVVSLFALNGKERVPANDSVWHDIYGVTGIRASTIKDAAEYAIELNNKRVADTSADDAKRDAFNAILSMYQKNSAINSANAALS